VLLVVFYASLWRVFGKAGRPGWAAIIPVYNWIELLRIEGSAAWSVVYLFIPVVNLIAWVEIWAGVAKTFGKGRLFACGLVVLPVVFLPVLAWGPAKHELREDVWIVEGLTPLVICALWVAFVIAIGTIPSEAIRSLQVWLLLIVASLFGAGTGKLWAKKGGALWVGFVVGFLFGPLGVLVMLLLKPRVDPRVRVAG